MGIARRIATAFGGEIRAKSTESKGSVFWVRLPFKIAQPQDVSVQSKVKGTGPAPVAVQTPRRILVVEDNEINRHVVREMLRRDGHEVTEACDGGEAVAMAGNTAFDLILMDISMPEMDGRQATRAIRSGTGPNVGCPIVAFTVNVLPEEVAAFHDDGMEDTLSKPLSKPLSGEALRQIIQQLANGRSPAAAPSDPVAQKLDLLVLGRIQETRDLIGRENFARYLGQFEAEMEELAVWLAQTPHAPRSEIVARCHKIATTADSFGATSLRLALLAAESEARDPDAPLTYERLQKVATVWGETRLAFRSMPRD